jgi:ClpX C4-type zinc finger
VRSSRVLLLCLAALTGFAIGAAHSSEVFRVIDLVLAVSAGSWVLRGIVDGMREPLVPGRSGRRLFDTYWPARCSHCGARGGPALRMVAGRDAYICELCLRRGIELLDSPDDITRFI